MNTLQRVESSLQTRAFIIAFAVCMTGGCVCMKRVHDISPRSLKGTQLKCTERMTAPLAYRLLGYEFNGDYTPLATTLLSSSVASCALFLSPYAHRVVRSMCFTWQDSTSSGGA